MIEDIVRYLILYFTVKHPFNFVFEKDNTFFELNVFLGGGLAYPKFIQNLFQKAFNVKQLHKPWNQQCWL